MKKRTAGRPKEYSINRGHYSLRLDKNIHDELVEEFGTFSNAIEVLTRTYYDSLSDDLIKAFIATKFKIEQEKEETKRFA